MAASLVLGTFTISNLGMFGVSSFVSILPPNQGAIKHPEVRPNQRPVP